MAKEISIEWSPEMERLLNFTDLKKGVLVKDVSRVTKNTLTEMHNQAFRRARKDTGFMRDNFFIEMFGDGLGGRLYGAAEYTVYNEYGTSRMPPRPAIRYAFTFYQKQYIEDLLKILEP